MAHIEPDDGGVAARGNHRRRAETARGSSAASTASVVIQVATQKEQQPEKGGIRSMDKFRAQLEHPKLIRFYDYWRSKVQAKGGKLPSRQDLDPAEIPDLLPVMFLVEVVREDGRLRYRHRLMGTELIERGGRDPTGTFFEEVFTPEEMARLTAIYDQVVASGTPHLLRADLEGPLLKSLEYVTYQRLLLPLAGDGETVDMLAGIYVFPGSER
jgi:hypothetical protein